MIDYILIYPKNSIFEDEDRYLKYVWRDIEWRTVFEMININLNLLYDNSINFWTTEQLEVILKLLIKLQETYTEDKLKDDINKLIILFTGYVENNCKIEIF
jgi:alpha-N-acetylglucosamine transferase